MHSRGWRRGNCGARHGAADPHGRCCDDGCSHLRSSYLLSGRDEAPCCSHCHFDRTAVLPAALLIRGVPVQAYDFAFDQHDVLVQHLFNGQRRPDCVIDTHHAVIVTCTRRSYLEYVGVLVHELQHASPGSSVQARQEGTQPRYRITTLFTQILLVAHFVSCFCGSRLSYNGRARSRASFQ